MDHKILQKDKSQLSEFYINREVKSTRVLISNGALSRLVEYGDLKKNNLLGMVSFINGVSTYLPNEQGYLQISMLHHNFKDCI